VRGGGGGEYIIGYLLECSFVSLFVCLDSRVEFLPYKPESNHILYISGAFNTPWLVD
jgi:hypothetical protein